MSPGDVRTRWSSANIFINYRREDSAGHAGRLFDGLSVHFAGRLFMDIDNLEPGVDFVDAITQAVGSCEVLIVIIGREWLTIEDKAGRQRLDNPDDFVRLEVETALERRIRVIPVLVQDASMPRADEMPASLARLARRNAIELSDARWAYDVDRLAHTIEEILKEKPAPLAAPAAMPPPLLATPVVAAPAAKPRAWWIYAAALVLAAVVVLASLAWMRRTPSGNSEAEPAATIDEPITDDTPPDATGAGAVRPARAKILSPRNGETVGPDVMVKGIVTNLGDQQIFMGIRQGNGSIYPRGELFPENGRWAIKVRSSREKTFDILVVASNNPDANRMLRDQRSRDNGLAILPPGASISSGIVTLRRQGRIGSLLNSKPPGSPP